MSASTIGQELEWADVDRTFPVPEHLGRWSEEDYSIVNSDGHANCPTGATWSWGGEINTRPTSTPESQAEIVRELAELYQPTINYKCNHHVHVRHELIAEVVEGRCDVGVLKVIAERMREAESFVYSVIEPIAKPTPLEFPNPDELKGAILRYRRNLGSHQHSLSEERFIEMMSARTFDEFIDAHAPPTIAGGRAWHVVKRPGMNLRSLRKHGTIEFRHFPGTADPDESESAARWCQLFVDGVIDAARTGEHGGITARRIYETRGPWKFPQFRRYDHALQLGFETTKWKK